MTNPISTAFDASSEGNQKSLKALDRQKRNGWIVANARRDPDIPTKLLIDYADPQELNSDRAEPALSIEGNTAKPIRISISNKKEVTLDSRPDMLDFRDKMFESSLIEVPSARTLEQYQKEWKQRRPLVLDQGREGACTGFGLATVANFLLQRRKVTPDSTPVSTRMLYEMARRYDEWEGENYSGSSARGAMKGWHKHGVCSDKLWPYSANTSLGTLSPNRAWDAIKRPLGAYFRVNHRDLVAMHCAIAEVGILYATASVHEGWQNVPSSGLIENETEVLGGHAFAIVGYDQNGFWIQNSWGKSWGKGGFGHISYDDWLVNGTDVWVARLGAPVISKSGKPNLLDNSATRSIDVRRASLQSHTIAIGNNGQLRSSGEVGNKLEDVLRIFKKNGDLESRIKNWTKPKLLLYAHGGLANEDDVLQRLAETLPVLLEHGIYPVMFMWKSDFLSTLGNIINDIFDRRRPEGVLSSLKDFLLDRIDDTLETLVRGPGKLIWDELKENATLSTTDPQGGAKIVMDQLPRLLKEFPDLEIHLAGHSAGSIFWGPWIHRYCGLGGKIASLTLWAPACTMKFFETHYHEALKKNQIDRFALFTLTDTVEQDDHCAHIYHKSLLYLIAHALENRPRRFIGEGTPLLGLEKFILKEESLVGASPDLGQIAQSNPATVPLNIGKHSIWIRSPNSQKAERNSFAARAKSHAKFDDDEASVLSTLYWILESTAVKNETPTEIKLAPTDSDRRKIRNEIDS